MTENEAIGVIKRLIGVSPSERIVNAVGIVVSALEEIQQYRSIGTISECRKAVEKQRAKKVLPTPNHSVYAFECPICHRGYAWCIRHRYCDCGQLLDWSDLN